MRTALYDPDSQSWTITAGMAIDADGSPRAYNAANTGLDDLRNGGPASDPYGYELNPHTGRPFVQGEDAPAFDDSTKGFFVSSTTYQRREYAANDPHRYLNSETENFIVVPGSFRRHVPGIALGCRAEVEFNGVIKRGIVGDIGPDFGEASIAFAKAFGQDVNGVWRISPNARTGGVNSGVTFRIFPGVSVPGYELQAA